MHQPKTSVTGSAQDSPAQNPSGKRISPETNELKDRQQKVNTILTPDRDRRPKAVKQLTFRIDETTHERIHLAARKADKSINAWMEEILSEAADDTLGHSRQTVSFHSPVIRRLVEEEELAGQLAQEIESYLQVWDLRSVFQFKTALQKLLVGIDEVRLFLQNRGDDSSIEAKDFVSKDTTQVALLTSSILEFLPSEDPLTILIFSRAIKKLSQGLAAVKPFLIEDKNRNTKNIVITIEKLINSLENIRPTQ